MNLGLTGLRAVVTGGANGIGRETVRSFAAEGATVGIVDKDLDGASAVVDELTAQGADVYAISADVSAESEVAAAMREARRHGAIDILVNNAAIYGDQTTDSMSAEIWDRIQGVNLRSAFLCTKEVLPDMKLRRAGSIVFVSSLAGRSGGVRASSAYASSKAGLIGLCRSVAMEAAPVGVRVNCVNPGVIDTRMTQSFPEQERARILSGHPRGRWGRPGEVADVIVFVASPRCAWMAGAQLDVNGGVWPTP